MKRTEEIEKLIYRFENLGIEKSKNGAILVGKAPHKAPQAWLNEIYPVLNDSEINQLEKDLNTQIPFEYKDFLLNFSNGLSIIVSTLSLDGLRKQLGRDVESSRQPYSLDTINLYEKPKNAKEGFFFIGGYDWDGSHLYIDKEINLVHCCERWDSTPRATWSSVEEMLISELHRIYKLFDEKGIELNENIPTIPY